VHGRGAKASHRADGQRCATRIGLLAAACLLGAGAADASSAGLAAALTAEDPDVYLRALDDAVWADLVGSDGSPVPDRPPADPQRLRATLSTGQAIVVLHPEGDTVWTAVITSEGAERQALDAPQVPVMAARLAAWRRDPRSVPFDAIAAQLLHDDLFRPLQTPLAGRAHLILVTSGVLRDVPFGALVMLEAVDLPPEERPYLALRFALSHEATVFSRLGWTAPSGALVRVQAAEDGAPSPETEPFEPGSLVVAESGGDGRREARAALLWMRNGAAGAVLGGGAEAVNAFYARQLRERLGGRRPDVSAVRRVRGACAREGLPPESWAIPRLWGAE
jgi:hypothetical protein